MKKYVKLSLIVVGAGGTGTYFLKEVSRYLAAADREKIARMLIVDGDTVERKNLSRQAFTSDDIGRNKAEVMAEVLNECFGLTWQAVTEYLTELEQMMPFVARDSIPVVIGCIDNHGARLLLEEFFKSQKTCIYMDAANEFHSGECVFSAKVAGTVYSPCRSYFFPDMLDGDTRGRSEISCEELNNSAPQHILANMASGLQLLSAFISFYEDATVTCGYSVYDPFRNFSKFYKAEDCKWVPLKEEVAEDGK